MPSDLQNVQWLTISEISELWSKQLNVPQAVVQRELRYGIYKIEKFASGELRGSYDELKKPLSEPPPEADLPSSETLLTKEFLERFADKQSWMLPNFWFDDWPLDNAYPGRPSLKNAVAVELKRVAETGELAPTLAEQARYLEEWARKTFPAAQTPTVKTVENQIRMMYNQLKSH